MKTAIFLGAGASAAEGAPLQNALFREYFVLSRQKRVQNEMDRDLATFFSLMFGIDTDHSKLDAVTFPTFEEVLGLVDLAILRKESFKEFDLENRASNSNRLRFIRQYLVFLMAQIIYEKLHNSKGHHIKLINKLRSKERLGDCLFISTNYDILIDNALTELYPHTLLDYGVDFTNFKNGNDWQKPDAGAIKLFKIHGSLNWLYCSVCNNLTLTPKEKGVIRLVTKPEEAICKTCNSLYLPLIVPPTYYKDLSNVFLGTVWNKTENCCRDIEHLIFCGYSFPEADIHIKYLLKRIQTNNKNELRITVINNHPQKLKQTKKEEHSRYCRFFGLPVQYMNLSFSGFARNPLEIIK